METRNLYSCRDPSLVTSVPVRSFASDIHILYTIGRSCERVCGPVAEEIILCSSKMMFIVCYIARVPVCVCDGRTILFCPVLGVFCDATQRELTNNSSDLWIQTKYRTYSTSQSRVEGRMRVHRTESAGDEWDAQNFWPHFLCVYCL